MFDLHSHLPSVLDDRAADPKASPARAYAFGEPGVERIACTAPVMPGMCLNSRSKISQAVASLVEHLGQGAQMSCLTLAESQDLLVKPLHGAAPAHFEICSAALSQVGGAITEVFNVSVQ